MTGFPVARVGDPGAGVNRGLSSSHVHDQLELILSQRHDRQARKSDEHDFLERARFFNLGQRDGSTEALNWNKIDRATIAFTRSLVRVSGSTNLRNAYDRFVFSAMIK